MSQSMMSPPLIQAWQSKDRKSLWEAYKAEWDSWNSPPMSSEIFNFLFYARDIAREATTLVRQSSYAEETIRAGATQNTEILDLEDSDINSILCSIFNPDEMIDLWRNVRTRLFAAKREEWARSCIESLVRRAGRAWVRQQLPVWWNDCDLLEEEREAILSELSDCKALTRDLVHQLGPGAETLARRLVAQGRIPSTHLTEAISRPTFRGVASEAADRLAVLLELVEIETDLRDADLRASELARLGNDPSDLAGSAYFSEVLRKLPPPLQDEFEWALRKVRGRLFESNGRDRRPRHLEELPFLVPLIRLLHMRLILEAPVLAPSLARPESSLVPEVLLYLLGRDAVTYVPELRVHAEVERRWRAKWAEITGEALSAIFLEEALDLDLTTLSRIEERTDQETPDFRAATIIGEPIVFESKGSTEFRTHKRQRTKALGQLGKRKRSGANTWVEQGRAFACCLFAAQYGTGTSTLFYVADPPFAFRHLFHKGWEEDARRWHYAALAEAAGLFELADSIIRRDGVREESAREAQTFSLDLERSSIGREREGAQFLGTYISLQEQARRLRHPRPEAFDKIRMFTGLRADLVRKLANGELPGPTRREEISSREETEEPEIPRTGTLPDRENAGNVRGVFSLLSDGAFLAFEVE